MRTLVSLIIDHGRMTLSRLKTSAWVTFSSDMSGLCGLLKGALGAAASVACTPVHHRRN
jgi:L-cysteine desulfidase